MSNNIKKAIIFSLFLLLFARTGVAFAGPQSTTYEIKSYDFGSGGSVADTSTSYSLFGNTGQVDGLTINSTTYSNEPGLSFTIGTNTPAAPTVSNNSNTYYNKLSVTLDTGSNPSDTVFAIKVVSSGTQYVQADHTLGASPVWQTNDVSGWNSSFTIIGLTTGTSYTVSVSAKQGTFTQSPWSAGTTVSTAIPTLSFSLSSNSVSLNQINPASVVTSSSITATVTSNGTGGVIVYGYDNNNGLVSSSTTGSITSATADLGATAGYGLQATGVTQSSGGPMESLSPYNGSSDNVGILTTSKASIFDSTSAPVTSGQGTFVLKAKATNTTKAAGDYADIVTIVTAATF
ncbi:MAG: hypothetical protein ACREGI_04040 [Candidatus Levyibacteriota bacterium]